MKCGKVKNPCKICFQSVSNKNGIQCKGACKKWAHYKCLNYTPGKICDIKAGLIKITCPCPDCTTSEPKEVLTNPPYTCTNQECPATKLPACESVDCPSKQKPIPQYDPTIQTSPKPECRNPEPQVCPAPAKIISPKLSNASISPKRSPPKIPLVPPYKPVSPIKKPASTPKENVLLPRRTPPPPKRTASPPRRPDSPKRKQVCPSCSIHCPRKRAQYIQEKLCSPQRSQSSSMISTKSCDSGKSCYEIPRSSSSCSEMATDQDQKMLYSTIEQMCETVGLLSKQLKDLMCNVTNAFENRK